MKTEDGKLDEQSAQTNASTAREPDPDTIKMFVGQVGVYIYIVGSRLERIMSGNLKFS